MEVNIRKNADREKGEFTRLARWKCFVGAEENPGKNREECKNERERKEISAGNSVI